MEKKLAEAAIEGDTAKLDEILEEDPLILDRIIVSCLSDTPLHTAAALGHLGFVQKLLTQTPELAAELDSRGCSPLHLAAAKGHAGVVRELLIAGCEVGFVRNFDGRTALHLAAVKGRAAVLAEMVRVNPELIQSVTDRGETGLHLCVKWNRVEALKVLGEEMSRNADVLNSQDCDGNTALHIAISNKNLQIIEYLIALNPLQVNTLNKSGLTPLDVLRQSLRGLRDMEIERTLNDSGASSSNDLHLITDDRMPSRLNETNARRSKKPAIGKKSADWLGRKRSSLMVVASLIATVAFQAGLTPPGGVWQDDYVIDENGNAVADPHSVGHAVMAYKEPKEYGIFMICNTVAFLSSLSIILILVSGLPLTRRRWMWVQMVIMWVAITALEATYFITLVGMSPDGVGIMLRKVTENSVLAWMTVMAVVFVGNVVRLNLWVLRKYGLIKEKKKRRDEEEEEEEEEDDDEDVI